MITPTNRTLLESTMVTNAVVQTIRDAEIDARSLSEFVSKDASFMVARRLAPTVHTLDYYLSFFNKEVSRVGGRADSALTSIGDTVTSVDTEFKKAQSLLNNVSRKYEEAVDTVNRIEPRIIQMTNDAINNTAVEGGILADTFVTATIGMAGAIARTQKDKNSERVSVKDFGAKGDNNQTLISVSAYKSDYNNSISYTQQTVDGDAINKAIRYLRSIGGGSLHIPKGIYRVFGYLERIDFPCVIYGDGAVSCLKNCDNSPTNIDGYGILCIAPQNYEEVTLSNLTLDGNADIRIMPTGEKRSYPVGVYGKPQLRMIGVSAINSPIDCFMTAYAANDPNTFTQAVNCKFDNAFRNTVSLVAGWNQSFTNCSVTRGGYVHGGTNPRYCVDVEPNLVGRSIENIQFANCYFAMAVNVIVGGVWAAAQFSNCVFDGSSPHSSKVSDKTFPWIFQLTEGQWQLNNCKFIGRKDYMQNTSQSYNSYNEKSTFSDSQYLQLNDCSWVNCGFNMSSRSVEIKNCTAQNSLYPFIFQKGTETELTDVFIRGLKLTNVFDGGNFSAGSRAAFSISSNIKGVVDIDDVVIDVDESSLKKMNPENFTTNGYYGVHFGTLSPSTYNKRVVISNVYSGGFYKKLPTFLSKSFSTSNFRDWGNPSLPPADTDMTNRTIGDKTTNIYKGCSMWGNF